MSFTIWQLATATEIWLPNGCQIAATGNRQLKPPLKRGAFWLPVGCQIVWRNLRARSIHRRPLHCHAVRSSVVWIRVYHATAGLYPFVAKAFRAREPTLAFKPVARAPVVDRLPESIEQRAGRLCQPQNKSVESPAVWPTVRQTVQPLSSGGRRLRVFCEFTVSLRSTPYISRCSGGLQTLRPIEEARCHSACGALHVRRDRLFGGATGVWGAGGTHATRRGRGTHEGAPVCM